MKAKVYKLSISPQIGLKKYNVPQVFIDEERGIIGDAHGTTDRPVSLLPFESFRKINRPDLDLKPGDFAENITTIGLDFSLLHIGTIIQIGESARLEVIQIGKECHEVCAIKSAVGDCIMPREGVFAKVINAGEVHTDDPIVIETS